MLEALRDEHELSLLTWEPPDLAACNRYFGTSLRPGDFRLHLVPAVVRRLGRLTPTSASLLKHTYLVRSGHALAARHDVVLGANNEVDFGRPGVQYIHYPKIGMARPEADLHWYHASQTLLGLYARLCARVGHFSTARMRANLTLVNSAYIGDLVRSLHGIEPVVLHPPVPGDFPPVPWEERADAFVCIGRISREKRIETIVDVLRRVRAAGGEVGLHVVGTPDDPPCWRRVRALAREHAAWMTLHTDLPRAELVRLVAHQRWGIHAMAEEHFGIAVAEMVRAGCIVFVPDDGGQVEIVGEEARLRWTSPEDAVGKILATLADTSRQAALRAHLAERAGLFSTERFCSELRALVRDLSARQPWRREPGTPRSA
jgi:glycosyltransferase involved in cell wall biosynthesis